MRISDWSSDVCSSDLIGIVRSERRLIGRLLYESIRAGDVLMVQSDSETLQKLVKGQKLELAERDTESETETEKRAAAEELTVAEAVIKPASWVKGRTAATLELRRHWEIKDRKSTRLNSSH